MADYSRVVAWANELRYSLDAIFTPRASARRQSPYTYRSPGRSLLPWNFTCSHFRLISHTYMHAWEREPKIYILIILRFCWAESMPQNTCCKVVPSIEFCAHAISYQFPVEILVFLSRRYIIFHPAYERHLITRSSKLNAKMSLAMPIRSDATIRTF